jgi:hypothetical protein
LLRRPRKSAIADLRTRVPMSGKPDIGGLLARMDRFNLKRNDCVSSRREGQYG